LLAFDNTSGLATGLALANSSPQATNVSVVLRDQTGAQIGSGTITLAAQGHSSFVLADRFQASAKASGTAEFDASSSGQIGVLGLRFTPGGAFTTIPVLANLSGSGGTMAHLASGGGWQTSIQLVNAGTNSAQAHLRFYGNDGSPLSIPLSSSDGAINTTASALDPVLAAHSTVNISTGGATGSLQTGSAQLTSDGGISGFIIFHSASGQEAVVPLESNNAGAYFLAFDNTSGLVTGLAIANSSTEAADIPVIIRDHTGAQIASSTISLPAQGHTSFVLTDQSPVTAETYGTIEFDTPAGGQISVLGLRFSPSGVFTTIPVLGP
jgi:hypothetical protein